jgi:hypothetical protein
VKFRGQTKKQIQVALSAFAVVAFLAACLSFCQSAQANPGDDRYLSKFEEEYLEETQLLKKEQEMEVLEQGDEEGTDERVGKVAKNRSETVPDKMMRPKNTAKSAPAESQAGQTQAANSAGEIARDMACMAIDYASRFMKNFTTADGNRWNNYRNQIFVPIALLLILPGALLTQVRAIMAQSNPILGGASPLEGIQRGLITIFLVPGSCLVTNYSIDLGNSLHHSVCSEYSRIIGGDMYRDAMCAEIRAFGTRALSENEGSLQHRAPDLSARGSEPFAKIEGRIWGKINDPCTGLLLVPANRDDMIMPQATIATRLGMYTANAGICAGWGMLTAFQMAFFYYLYFAGPIMAALWAWPTQTFKNAFPTWVESCVTLAFWSFLWQITIALLAMTKSPASSGLYMVTALNVLATTSVKHAFDCASIMKSAVQACEQIGAEVAQAAGSGGGGGGKGGGKGGKKGSSKKDSAKPAAAPDKVAEKPEEAPVKVAARVEPKTEREGDARKPSRVPAILTTEKQLSAPAGVIVETTLPPAARAALTPLADSLRNTVFDDARLAAFVATALAPDTESFAPDTESFTTSLNSTTGVWNDPVAVGTPPSAGHPIAPARNTIASVLGNAIQEIMVYPAGIPIQDPDLIYLDKVKAEIEQQNQQNQQDQQAQQDESEKQSVEQTQNEIQSVSENFSPNQNLYPTPEPETEMNSNDDPRIAALRDQRFNYPPPPMVSGQPAAGFSKIPSGAALTPHQLLSKLQTVVDEATSYAPPPPSGQPSTPPFVPSSGFSRVEGNQNFQPQGEAIVTVVDFTADLQGQPAPQPRQASLHDALSQVLRQRDVWKQSQPQVRPPVPQAVSDGWWS